MQVTCHEAQLAFHAERGGCFANDSHYLLLAGPVLVHSLFFYPTGYDLLFYLNVLPFLHLLFLFYPYLKAYLKHSLPWDVFQQVQLY